jgi:ATP-dependent DNA helicase RecG
MPQKKVLKINNLALSFNVACADTKYSYSLSYCGYILIQIGRADVLGSGVRNLYRFTKMYSGEEPELIDGDVFKTLMPLGLSLTEMSDNGNMSDNSHKKILTIYLETNSDINTETAAQILNRAPETARRILGEMASEGLIIAEGGNRNRRYRLAQ